MRKYFHPAAFWVTAGSTVFAAILRIFITPRMQETETGIFKISFLIIGFLLAVFAVLAILTAAGKSRIYHPNDIPRQGRMPISVSAVILGLVLIASSAFDWWQWASFGRTPPPNEVIISRLDAVTLTFTLFFGILAGIFFVYLGFRLAGSGLAINPQLSLSALAPVVWIWVRIVRYEISYSSAIPVEQSFYDFVMIIFTMLFLFSFSKYVSRIAKQQSSRRSLLFFSLCAALMSLSGPVASVSLYMLGETDAYNASRLAGFSDFCIGIFAFCTSVVLVFGGSKPEAGEEFAGGESLDQNTTEIIEQETDEPEERTPTVDEIIEDLRKHGY